MRSIRNRHAEPRSRLAVDLGVGVREAIHEHVSIHPDREVGGVLVGHTAGARTTIRSVIPGFQALAPGEPLRVTAETWQAVALELSRYGQHRIVGWYHSHPSSGSLLSPRHLDIHRRYFNSPEQIALVLEPDGRETWYRCENEKIVRLGHFTFEQRRTSNSLRAQAGRARTRRVQNAGTCALWMQRAACTLAGLAIGGAVWATVIRTSNPDKQPGRPALRPSAPVAHPIVVEPQAGVPANASTTER